MNTEQIRQHLISAGVKNLKEFGYINVTSENIITDEVYSQFFKSMLEENIGQNEKVDEVINQLLQEIK